jgi:hypothetical protein
MSGRASEEHGGNSGPQDLQRLLARLDLDPKRAWEVYEYLRRKLVRFFEHNHCFGAEELAEEALDRISRKLNLNEIQDIGQYAFGVAKTLKLESKRKALRHIHLEDLSLDRQDRGQVASPENDILARIDQERKLYCLQECMKRLLASDRQLLIQYYPGDRHNLEKRRRALADSTGIKLGALRTKTARLRDKLEECIRNCCARRRSRSTEQI